MPLVAIGVAVLADVSAGAALAAGTLGTFEAIGAVGATISAIGAVTGNKTLSTVGMVLGGVGGIGSLASAAGVIDDPSVTSVFGTDATAVTAPGVGDTMTAADNANLAGDADTSGIDLGDGASGDMVNSVAASVGDAGNPVATTAAASEAATPPPVSTGTDAASAAAPASTAQISGNTGTETGSNVGNNLDYANPTGDPTQPVTPTNPVSPAIANGAASTPAGQAPAGTVQAPAIPDYQIPGAPTVTPPSVTFAAPTLPAADASGTSGFMGFLSNGNNAGLLGMGAIQAVGSLIAGATNPLTPAQISQLNAQAAQNQAAANLQTMQNTNMAQPIPTASRSGPNLGLINTPTPANTNAVPGSVAA